MAPMYLASSDAFRRTKLVARKKWRPEAEVTESIIKEEFSIPEELEIEIAKMVQFETEEIGLPRLLVKLKDGNSEGIPRICCHEENVTHKAIKHYEEEVFNPNKKDFSKERLPRILCVLLFLQF
ncbi:hypothetical protein BUALT_Bualt10G0073800 [Buddleja alternifolia]|uniref:Uncharacterized protein n=1 Tax=Buddleja alternifolia TaxID=168488 RepID=A0AAV6WY89_9LAMI|nr:hypothetical protein BUALT_Bualt18G0032800 [Buddleja alternifolia]KAG8375183.1 hypothetical protein BUALT_Bualt10G0073800 [Buddleja alternifolia]